jgi:S1-C subfamily serine protease
MTARVATLALAAIAVALAVIAARPHVDHLLYAEPHSRAVAPAGEASEAERATIALFEAASPSVVHVIGLPPGSTTQSMQAEPEEELSTGTGFLWDRAGHVVTNSHVVADSETIALRFVSGDVVEADVVGLAPNYELAVLRVRATTNLPPPLALGSSKGLKVGQSAFAIGNPFGLDQSLTVGTVSALKRRLPTKEGREIANVIQTDAAINPGNSGGPLLDSSGRLIGVTTAIVSATGSSAGIGFAIPADVVNRVVPELIRHGRVPTPAIGIVAATEVATARLGVEGVVILGIRPGSPAEKAGLSGVDESTGALGDVIVAANGKPTPGLSELTDAVEETGVGGTVRLTVERSGKSRTIDAAVVDIDRLS